MVPMVRCLRAKNFIFPLGATVLLLLSAGCLYHLTVKLPSPPEIDIKELQRVVLFPIPPSPHSADGNTAVYSLLRDSLEKKGYVLAEKAEVSAMLEEMKITPFLLLSDPDSLRDIGLRLRANLLIIGTIPLYKIREGSWGAQTTQVWGREGFDYLALPTYFWGRFEMRLVLRMFEAKNGDLVWTAEGNIHGLGASAENYAKKLVDRLLKGLPQVPPEGRK
jgi:hypothetical protein